MQDSSNIRSKRGVVDYNLEGPAIAEIIDTPAASPADTATPRVQRRSVARDLRLVAGLTLLLVGLLVWLRGLDYSRAWFEPADLGETLTADKAVAGFSWDPAPYVGAPALAAYAAFKRQSCGDRAGVAAAVCLGDILAARFIQGVPSQELFDAKYRPEDVLKRHLDGEPGHCVSRSGIITTALLASGIPARMVQLQPPTGEPGGHNALEVYEPGQGWVFIDPTYGGELESPAGGRSAAALLADGGRARWLQTGKIPSAPGSEPLDGALLYAGDPSPLLAGHLVYPEPWLYTRVGHKMAPWPFQASYLVVGAPGRSLTNRRRVLYGCISLTAVALVLASTRTAHSIFRARTRSAG